MQTTHNLIALIEFLSWEKVKQNNPKTMSHPVQKREAFLIDVYHEYHPGRDAFNYKKSKRKERASRLIDELRDRYNVNKPVWMSYSFHPDTTPDNISENGKYALD